MERHAWHDTTRPVGDPGPLPAMRTMLARPGLHLRPAPSSDGMCSTTLGRCALRAIVFKYRPAWRGGLGSFDFSGAIRAQENPAMALLAQGLVTPGAGVPVALQAGPETPTAWRGLPA